MSSGDNDLFGGDTEVVARKTDRPARKSFQPPSGKQAMGLIGTVEEGLAWIITGAGQPLFELTEGEGERAR
jgi:hypothetical protein